MSPESRNPVAAKEQERLLGAEIAQLAEDSVAILRHEHGRFKEALEEIVRLYDVPGSGRRKTAGQVARRALEFTL